VARSLPAEPTPAAGPTRVEVVGPRVEDLSEDDLRPLGREELGAPPCLAEFEQHGLPLLEGLDVVDDPPPASDPSFGHDPAGQLVNVDDVDSRDQVGAAQCQQARA
jgi:hypothetical protein